MNTFLKYILLSFLLVSSSCSSEDGFVTDGQSPRNALVLTVSAGDFVTAGSPATRAADNGATTTFENGDKVGVIILDGSGNLLSNNIPYKYNGVSWQFDDSNGEGKTQCYYDSQAKTYIVYYPYSTTADNITSEAGLKGKFAPKNDQSSKEDYRASDLLVWTSSGSSLKKLTVELKHAYASVFVSPNVKYQLANGEDFTYVSSLISDVSLTVNNNTCTPYPDGNGSYRFILPADFTTGDVSCLFTFDSKKYSSTVSPSVPVSANTRYTFVPTVNGGEYKLDKAQMGDFYCGSSDGSIGYLIPRDIISLPADVICLGVVLKAGKEDSGDWKDDCQYKLKDTDTDMNTIHGYVLALKNADVGSSCVWGSEGTSVVYEVGGTDMMNRERYTGFYGYKNTQAIILFNQGKGGTLSSAFPAAYYATTDYESKYAAPANSSGWFLPSAGQCKYWVLNKDILKSSMDKAGGDGWFDYYWSSSEESDGPTLFAWYMRSVYDDISESIDLTAKSDDEDMNLRSCLAF